MTNKEKIEQIKKWQMYEHFHPLTCGNDSNHEILKPIEIEGKVILVCPQCDYKQHKIPSVVLDTNLDKWEGEMKNINTKDIFLRKKKKKIIR